MKNPISRFGLLAALACLPALGQAADAAQYVQWGNQMIASKKYDDALKYFSGAIKADPKSAAAYKGLGYAYIYKGDKAKALPYLKYALQLNPADSQLSSYVAGMQGSGSSPAESAEQSFQYGSKYMESKQYAYAAYYFNQATVADPKHAKAWQGLGDAYAGQAQKAKAIAAWEHAISLDPGNSELAAQLAQLKGASPSADSAPTASASSGQEAKAVNPWIMGGTIAALGAVMLFLF